MKTLYFDCFSGASGDMIVGALIDAGAPFAVLQEKLAGLNVAGFSLSAEKVNKKGIMATKFDVHVEHTHHHPHRHLSDILDILASAQLPEAVRINSEKTFRAIAECEAAIHGTSVEEVHFHEVGAVDSIIDVIGAHLAMELLGVERVVCSPLHVGSGVVRMAHGVLPVPAPATAMLLQGVPCYGGDVDGELVTPTGAAIIRQRAAVFGPMPAMRVQAIGYGSGTRDLPDRPNVLRVMLGDTEPAGAEDTANESEPITVIEANIDDMNPEMFPPLIADLLAQGARDAFLTAILGKKGRPGHLLTVLCDEAKTAEIIPLLFSGSTTLGVRMRQEHRVCLEREWKEVQTPWGPVRIKIGRYKGKVTSMSPEFEDCRRVALESGVPVLNVYDAARAEAVKGGFQDE
jgi:hypothetical protein